MASIINAATSGGLVTTADTSGILQLQTAGTTAVTVDASQNVGVGVTPSSWNTLKAIEQQNGVFWASYSGDADSYFGANAYYSSGWFRKITGNASYYRQTTGQHQWAVAASSTANSAISFTQAMTLDASGNLGIGTTSPSYKIDAIGSTSTNSGIVTTLRLKNGGEQVNDGAKISFTSGTSAEGAGIGSGGQALNSADLRFYAGGNTERARITTSGEFIMGGTSVAPLGSRLSIVGATTWGVGPTPAGSTFYIYNSSNVGVYLSDGANTWASSSDERKKDIIEPITDASNKVNQLRAVIGKYKTDAEGTRRSFLIAQDLQTVLPESVDSSEKDNLGVRYTDVIPLLVAAIKEQQTVITSLKARLDAANL
jgi:hypothetical protein